MKSKPTFSLLSILLLLTVLGSTLILSSSPVFANPVCGTTITTNTTLTGNIGPCSVNGLIIGANGITLNCAGHTISGKSGNTNAGINLTYRTKVTVEKCKVTGFGVGIYLFESSSNTITGNTANKNSIAGFELYVSSSKNTLTGNTATGNKYYGFILDISSSNTLTGNMATSTGYGFFLNTASSNTLTKNTANSNQEGFDLVYSSSKNTLSGNTANSNTDTGFLLGSSSNSLTGNTANSNTNWGYGDSTVSSSAGVPHWDTANSYGTTVAALSTTGDKGSGNGLGLAYGNANLDTATSPF